MKVHFAIFFYVVECDILRFGHEHRKTRRIWAIYIHDKIQCATHTKRNKYSETLLGQ